MVGVRCLWPVVLWARLVRRWFVVGVRWFRGWWFVAGGLVGLGGSCSVFSWSVTGGFVTGGSLVSVGGSC